MTLEIVTLIMGIVGEVISIWGLLSCITDLNYLTALNLNGARRIVGIQNISREAFRMLIQLVIVVVGLFCVVYPEQPALFLIFFCIISLIVIVTDVSDRVRRVQLEHLYDQLMPLKLGRRKTDATVAALHKEITELHQGRAYPEHSTERPAKHTDEPSGEEA